MESLLRRCAQVLGDGGLLTGADVRARTAAWGSGPCEAAAILRPASTAELSHIMRLCHQARQPVVAQGGRTGRSDGCVAGPREVAISLERMRRIEGIDPLGRTLTVQSGVTLQAAQQAAHGASLLLPLDFGARGSATIGGCIATNAGGHRVMRFGMTRNLVLGLEAVLADGRVIDCMSRVTKNNAGYDLKQWFIGSEGTLGIVTRAVLKLSTPQHFCQTALVAAGSFAAMTHLLQAAERRLEGRLSAFEAMWRSYYALASGGAAPPLPAHHPYYVLIESMGNDEQRDQAAFEDLLSGLMEEGHALAAVVARSGRERERLWAIRENTAAYLAWRPVFNYDVSLPIDAMERYVDALEHALRQRWPALRMAVFGHLGDGNLHLAISSGERRDHHAISDRVYSGLTELGGSISGEHGIGLARRDYLHYCRSPEEIAVMRAIKAALDPHDLLNPGKVIPAA